MGRHEGRRPACRPGVPLSGLASSLASFPSQVVWSLGRWEIRICSLGPVRWRLEGLDWRVRHLPRACSEMAAAVRPIPGGRRRGHPAVAPAQGASLKAHPLPLESSLCARRLLPGLVSKRLVHVADSAPVGKVPIACVRSQR